MLDNPFQQILDTRRKRAVIIDGGFATELEKTGKDLSQVPLAQLQKHNLIYVQDATQGLICTPL